MRRQLFALSAASVLLVAAGAAPPPAAAVVKQSEDYYCFSYDNCWPIAFYHEIYSDAELTNLIDTGYDSCNGGPSVTSPSLLAGYEVKSRMYVCSSMGPYLPPEW